MSNTQSKHRNKTEKAKKVKIYLHANASVLAVWSCNHDHISPDRTSNMHARARAKSPSRPSDQFVCPSVQPTDRNQQKQNKIRFDRRALLSMAIWDEVASSLFQFYAITLCRSVWPQLRDACRSAESKKNRNNDNHEQTIQHSTQQTISQNLPKPIGEFVCHELMHF